MSERPVDELKLLKSELDELNSAYVDLLEQNKRYREALEFYADERNYKERDFGIIIQPAIQDGDKGNTARKALEDE